MSEKRTTNEGDVIDGSLEETGRTPATHAEDSTNPRRNAPVVAANPPRRGGCGCWITGLLALFIAGMLVVAGLILPPVSILDRVFGVPYVMLDAEHNAYLTTDSSMTVILNPADVGRDFGVFVETVALNDFIAGNGETAAWIPVAQAAVPPYLALQSQVYHLQTTGEAPDGMTVDLRLPATAATQDTLDVYGWFTDTGRWEFLPAQLNTAGNLSVSMGEIPEHLALFQAAPLDPIVLTPVDVTEALTPNAAQVATIVAPAGLQPTLQGTLTGSFAPDFDINASYRVMPLIRNFTDPRALDSDTVSAILGNNSLRSAHIQQLVGVTVNNGFDGVIIDYRDLPVSQRDTFSMFIRDLKTSLRSANMTLGVVVPAAENQNGAWETGAYDWRAIGASADYVIVEFGLDPTSFTPGEDRLVEAMLRWAKGEVSRYKLIAGLNALSTRETAGTFVPVSYDEALAPLGSVTIEAETSAGGTVSPGQPILASLDGADALPGVDTQTRTPFIEYLNADGDTASRVWLTTGDALRFRMDRVGAFAIGGVALDDLVADGVAGDVFPAIVNYKLRQLPQAAQPQLALRWRIESANGVVSEVVTALNEELVLTLEPGQEGNFAVNVEVVGGDTSSARSGAAVAVFAPTATPTPPPTATPTPLPSPTPTLEVIVPTATSAGNTGIGPYNPGPAVNLGPGAIVSGFEYGGHVTGTNSEVAANAMRQAGMVWMKVQARYSPGRNPGELSQVISDAHGRGFKVLVGVVGNPADLAEGGGGYIQQFAGFLGGLAGMGPDAIEVWNEPNIEREWPNGQISGANYTAMLGASYQAIKSANPNVMVISAAPAPTGAEAAFPGAVVNDDRFLADMFAAGAANYMDCLGMHYNEGIVGPGQVGGDPRDDYYTRYLQGMLNTYWRVSGGVKPICITELGYLTREGYGDLGPFWAWAQNTTVAQQAAWLAEAIAIASQSGRVRMLIVWNIDFTGFNANDPQGGYAIVRPGGDCPACRAIAGAR